MRLRDSKGACFPILLRPNQKPASSNTSRDLCVSADPTSGLIYQFMDFYQLEIIWHVRFYSDLFTAPRQAGKEGAFITAVMGHSVRQDWGHQDVCGDCQALTQHGSCCQHRLLSRRCENPQPWGSVQWERSQQHAPSRKLSVPKRRCCRAAAVRGSALRKSWDAN